MSGAAFFWLTIACLVTVVFLAGATVGLTAGKLTWADPGRCDKVVGSTASIRGDVRSVVVMCQVEP